MGALTQTRRPGLSVEHSDDPLFFWFENEGPLCVFRTMWRGRGYSLTFSALGIRRRFVSSTPKTAPKLSVVLDSNASSRSIEMFRFKRNGEFHKENMRVKDLLRKTNLHARDLLPLEGEGLGRSASIQPREESIVVGVSHVRSIITTEEMFLFYPNSFAVQHFAQELSASLKEVNDMEELEKPHFELMALEGVLSNVADKYTRRISCFGPMIAGLLDELRGPEYKLGLTNDGNIGSSIATRILPLRNTLSSYERSSEGLMRSLERLMNDDADMAMMMLSERKRNPETDGGLDISKHEPIELILEAYYHRVEECVQSAFGLRKNIEATQELLNIALDDNRNRLIQTNVHMAILTVGLAFSTMVYGLFGMNLVSGLEEHPYMFNLVGAGAGTTGICVYIGVLRFMTGQTFSFHISDQRTRRKNRFSNTMRRQDAIKHIRSLLPTRKSSVPPFGDGAGLADINEALLCYLEDKGGAKAQLNHAGMLQILELTSKKTHTVEDVQIIFDAFDNNDDGLLDYDDVVNFVASQYESR